MNLKKLKELATKALPVHRGAGEYQILKEPFDRFKEEIQPETVAKLVQTVEMLYKETGRALRISETQECDLILALARADVRKDWGLE